jgi:uncharacterized protein YebE (UPF0316 family)
VSFLAENPALLAIAIFLARILDVSLGTLRTIIVFRGYRLLAGAIGFVEVLIWVLAAGQVLRDLSAWYLVLAFAGGFATGNVVGMWIESKLAMGLELVRAISTDPEIRLASRLRDRGHGVLELNGHGDDGAPVEVLFVVERRRRVPGLVDFVRGTDPAAICTVSDVRQILTPNELPRLRAAWFYRLKRK